MALGEGARGAAAGLAGVELPRRSSARVGRPGATGARLDCGLVQKNERDTCDPLGPRARVGDGRSVELSGVGGSAWRRIAGARCSRGSSVGTGVQGGRGGTVERVGAHRALETGGASMQRGRRRGSATSCGRRSRTGRCRGRSREQRAWGSSRRRGGAMASTCGGEAAVEQWDYGGVELGASNG